MSYQKFAENMAIPPRPNLQLESSQETSEILNPTLREIAKDVWDAVIDNDDKSLNDLLSEHKGAVNLKMCLKDAFSPKEIDEMGRGFSDCAEFTLLEYALRFNKELDVAATLLKKGGSPDDISKNQDLFNLAEKSCKFYGITPPQEVSKFFSKPASSLEEVEPSSNDSLKP